jgi:hypothetical protein
MFTQREVKKNMILDLRSEGRTIREIAKETHTSFKDIRILLNEALVEKEDVVKQMQGASLASAAIKLYSDGKDPLQVAISLKLTADDAIRYHLEYYRLIGINNFIRIYGLIKDDPWPFVKLFKLAQSAGINERQVIHLLDIANEYLPMVESKCDQARLEVDDLNVKKTHLEDEIRNMNNEIANHNDTLYHIRRAVEIETDKIKRLRKQWQDMQLAISQFTDSSEDYLKIRKSVHLNLSEGKQLLKNAFQALAHSVRNDPLKYASLLFFDNNEISSHFMNMSNYLNGYNFGYHQQQPFWHRSSEDYEAMLIEEAEKFYEKLTRVSMETTLAEFSSMSETSDSTSDLSIPLEGQPLKENGISNQRE